MYSTRSCLNSLKRLLVVRGAKHEGLLDDFFLDGEEGFYQLECVLQLKWESALLER